MHFFFEFGFECFQIRFLKENLNRFGTHFRFEVVTFNHAHLLPHEVDFYVPFDGGAHSAIVGEFIASDRGLGFIIVNAQYTMDTPAIFGALILVSLLGAGLFGLVGFLEWLAMPWRR